MKNNAMSLIVLIVTIGMIIILSGVVIVGLVEDNPVEKANEARTKAKYSNYKSDIAIGLSNAVLEKNDLTARDVNEITYEGVKKYVKSFQEEDEGKIKIKEGALVQHAAGVDLKSKEVQWALDAGIPVDVDETLYNEGLVAYFSAEKSPVYDEEGDYWYWPVTEVAGVENKYVKGAKIVGWDFPEGVEEEYMHQEFKPFVGSSFETKSGYDPKSTSYKLDGVNDYMVIDDDMILDGGENKLETSKITTINNDGSFTIASTVIPKKYGIMSKIVLQRPEENNYNFFGFQKNSKQLFSAYLGARDGGVLVDRGNGSVMIGLDPIEYDTFANFSGVFDSANNKLYVNGKNINTEKYAEQLLTTNLKSGRWFFGAQAVNNNIQGQYTGADYKTVTFWENALTKDQVFYNYLIEKKWELTEN